MELNNTPAIHMHGSEANLLIANEHDMVQSTLDIAMAKQIAEALNEDYPGHLWAVNVVGEQGYATIHNLMLSGQWGYRLLLDNRYSASELRAAAKRGAGEILERYGVRRGRADMDGLAMMPTDNLGRTLGDLSK